MEPPLPIREVLAEDLPHPSGRPFSMAPVRQLLDEGLQLPQLTVLVGTNGAGKPTLVEAIALAYGLSPEGGSVGAQLSTRPSESELWPHPPAWCASRVPRSRATSCAPRPCMT